MANPPTFDAEISSIQHVTSSSFEGDHNGVLVSPVTVSTQQEEGETPASWNEILFGNLFSKKPEAKRRIVKAIHPISSSELSALPPPSIQENGKENDDALDDPDDGEIDPLQWQKEERRRSAQERQRKLHAQMLQDRRFSSSPKMPPAEKVANPMSRFLSAFSIHAHPEHKRRAGPSTMDEDADGALLLSPKRPRPMEEEEDNAVEPTKEPEEERVLHAWHRGAYVALALGIVAAGFFFVQRPSRNVRPQMEL
jgi:hypothetical protein